MKPMIILPDTLYILREKTKQDIAPQREEYNIYYKNILFPYSEDFDVKIDCAYGKNLGHCWRLDTFGEESIFPLRIRIYLYAELLADKTVNVHLTGRTAKKASLLCIGDSMTRGEEYVFQAAWKLENTDTVGTRQLRYASHEGRGGWRIQLFLERFYDNTGDVSPFLFPKGIAAKDYYGSFDFWERVHETPNQYVTSGYKYSPIREGMYTMKDGTLCKFENGAFTVISESPEFEFSFEKYLDKHGFDRPDIVTFLFGANELQMTAYEDSEKDIAAMLARYETIIEHIKKDNTKIVINLPVCGADQYCWGTGCGCRGTVKQYDYNIKMLSKAIIEKYGNREDEGFFVCPMLAVCDPYTGFADTVTVDNMYTEHKNRHLNNWVHPNGNVGYKQMGDALAGVVCRIKEDM